MREHVVEDYLRQRVKETGGQIRKNIWPGHRGSPDDLCWWPGRPGYPSKRFAFVECKRPRGEPDPHQAREIKKMRSAGIPVFTIDTKEGVDQFAEEMTR